MTSNTTLTSYTLDQLHFKTNSTEESVGLQTDSSVSDIQVWGYASKAHYISAKKRRHYYLNYDSAQTGVNDGGQLAPTVARDTQIITVLNFNIYCTRF